MIRRMTEEHIPGAMRLKEAAGWNQLAQDWKNVLALEPDGCWVWEEHGEVVGTVTTTSYGKRLAWIGMMLVHPDWRRQGIGRALMVQALDYLEQRRIETIKLDATEMGRPLYASLGFENECLIERWGGTPKRLARSGEVVHRLQTVEEIALLDREAFGADRTRVLQCLMSSSPEKSFVCPGGYVMARPGANAEFVGPCTARDSDTARRLIRHVLALELDRPFFWDLFPGNEVATKLATQLGFSARRRLTRMWHPGCRGKQAWQPTDVRMQFAAAGLEFG